MNERLDSDVFSGSNRRMQNASDFSPFTLQLQQLQMIDVIDYVTSKMPKAIFST